MRRYAVPDIEDFVGTAKRADTCPFYLARELQTASEILFMPYNYLLDSKARRALNIDLSSDVLIFDEAHNIERVCADAASFNLTSLDVAGSVREIDRLLAGAKNRSGAAGADADAMDAADGDGELAATDGDIDGGGGGSNSVSEGDLLRAREMVLTLDETIAKFPLKATGRGDPRYVRGGEGLQELLAAAGIDRDNSFLFIELCDKCVATLGEAARFGVTAASSFNLGKLADCVRIAFDSREPVSEYRLCIQEMAERGGGGGGSSWRQGKAPGSSGVLDSSPRPRTLGYWCFHSGHAMRSLVAAGVHSVLLTSGTLSPLDSFADELGLPFAHKLENPHVINPPEQLLVATIPKGPSGHELTSSYSQRDAAGGRKDLGDALVNLARVIPQGLLVFFPSYSAMQQAHAAWVLKPPSGGLSVVERIKKLKTLVVEPRDSSELASSIETYQNAVKSSVLHGTGGAMLLAAPRKLSEGGTSADAAAAYRVTGRHCRRHLTPGSS